MTAKTDSALPAVTIEMDEATTPFWTFARAGILAIPCCGQCARFHMPPSPICPHCRSHDLAPKPVSGEGFVYSYCVSHPRSAIQGNDGREVLALVELPDAGGVRLFARLLELVPEEVKIGTKVSVRWIDVEDGWRLPAFAVRRSGDA